MFIGGAQTDRASVIACSHFVSDRLARLHGGYGMVRALLRVIGGEQLRLRHLRLIGITEQWQPVPPGHSQFLNARLGSLKSGGHRGPIHRLHAEQRLQNRDPACREWRRVNRMVAPCDRERINEPRPIRRHVLGSEELAILLKLGDAPKYGPLTEAELLPQLPGIDAILAGMDHFTANCWHPELVE